jgi:3-phosphoshikimate 1-carboxyvinyltransferase
MKACRLFGARITEEGLDGEGRVLVVEGTGGRIKVPPGNIDAGNSGTTLYFAAALAALSSGEFRFTGDEQLSSRPAGNLLRSLEDLGAQVSSAEGGRAPFTIRGPLSGGSTSIECPTSQYLSALLLACPLIPAARTGKGPCPETEIIVPLLYEEPYVEMTLGWLEEQGIVLEREGLKYFRIPGGQKYRAFTQAVPGDFSSAAFFLSAAALTGSTITLGDLDMNDSQGDKAIVSILASLGCGITAQGKDITITGRPLTGRDIDMNAIPDALPALAAAACFAEGTTRLLNVPQARLKETDRIRVMDEELTKMGARVRELPDGLEIRGGGKPALTGCRVNARADHRVVMALAAAALGAAGETLIETAEAASVSFPDFFALLERGQEVSFSQ